MAFWYLADVIAVEPPTTGSALLGSDTNRNVFPMLLVDAVEVWTVRHVKSGVERDVDRHGMRVAFLEEAGYAYEEDNPEPEVCLIRTEVAIPQAVLDECNAAAGGGTWVQQLTTAGQRDALYAAYPSLEGRWPDQP